MLPSNRRRFLLGAMASAASFAALAPARLRAVGANNRVRVGVIGAGGQGARHAESLATLQDVEVVYICDVDLRRLEEQKARAPHAEAVVDFRRILDDPSIQGVTIATPDHWHAPAALLAMAADKHVYLEKPCSHNFREGQLLVEAARKTGKIVVHGTQARSSTGMQEAMAMLREGVIGDVLIAKCWNWQRRENIGRQQPSPPPKTVDYDAWVGPAEWMPFQENRFHYDWHWWYNFGTGDIGNDGCHELDYALWGLGATTHPSTIAAVGGKYFFDDDQQFPDTLQVTFEWPGDGAPGNKKMLIYEQRLWSRSYPMGVDSGAEFYGTKGKMFVSKRGKFEVRGDRNRPIDRRLAGSIESRVEDNQQNWIDAIRSDASPHANIEIAHRTAAAAHLGNISARVGRTLHFDPVAERIIDDDEAAALLSRKYRADRHWGVPAGV
jgi:predicted dehydrogenase